MRKLILVLLMLGLAPPAFAQTYYANVQLTIDSTAGGVSFTSTDILIGSGHPQVNTALCVSNSTSGEFRYRIDGGAPTTTNGIPVPVSGAFFITNAQGLLNFKAIRTGGTSAVITCNFSDALTPPTSLVGAGGGGSGGSVTQGTDPWIISGTLDELPATAALADATANPTVSAIAAYLMGFNGTTWDRVRTSTDPCSGANKTFYADSQATGTQVLTGTASNKTYICSILITQATTSTQRFSVVAGTGSVCATNTVTLIGDTAGSTGVHTPFALGNGAATIAKSTVNADNICVLQSTTDAITVQFGYVVAP